ncbi:DUF3090 domain-containing protein [Cryobacterium melibiosiphilum]|uniref:DUF3090 domain-containing protein n=1 Tax=Cryobacterium melibiosiphilum TaxID=995039 RepID=A0A3A5MBA2_9MICO|nr:DUF3090 domain-containing protein [Cryobacterium melibiosiphilum]RJT85619.1 DUF3090 domain-containing protein [Cryobacterium melibiosiphilum]
MPTIVHEFAWPDRVVIGTIGLPGDRTFYLQARAGSKLVSIALEKQQSALLAEKIDAALDELMSTTGNPFSIPTTTPIELVDNDPLEPVVEEFRAGMMGLGWDPSTVQFVIEAYPIVDDEDEDGPAGEPAEKLLLRIPVGTARAFAKRTREIVGAGRPMCPLCGNPVDADGHTCTLPGVS